MPRSKERNIRRGYIDILDIVRIVSTHEITDDSHLK